MATHAKHLETAEVAYSAIMEADKVHYIQYIRELPIKEVRNAEMAVLTGTVRLKGVRNYLNKNYKHIP